MTNVKAFEEFAMQCMGESNQLMHLRGISDEDKLKTQKVSERYSEAIAAAKAVIAENEGMTPYMAKKNAQEAFEKAKARRIEQLEERKANKAHFESLLELAQQFVPPTKDHESLKELMVNKLVHTLEMSFSDLKLKEEEQAIANMKAPASGIEWLLQRDRRAQADLAENKEKLKKEKERVSKDNLWVHYALEAIKAVSKAEASK